MEKNIKADVVNNQVQVKIDPKVYTLETIYGAAYNLLEKAYFYFDKESQGKIIVQITGKGKSNKKELRSLAKEFLNELISVGLRNSIAKENKKIREYIISTALLGSSKMLQEKLQSESNNEEEWDEDPLGIATPWEEKHQKND